MTEDDAARGLPTCPATHLLRDGIPVCTTCGAVIGGADADQIRHSTWHTTLTALFAVTDPHGPVDQGRRTFGPPRSRLGCGARSIKTDLS